MIYGYVRVSTGRQASEGESLAVQRRQLEGYCHMHGFHLDVANVFVEEGVSGSTPLSERPAGKILLACLKPGDIVIAAKLDRVFRSALDALQVTQRFREQGINLHLLDIGGDVSGNGLSKLFLTVAAAFAEAERDRIRERVQNTKDDMKMQSRYLGGAVPFGFVVTDGRLVEDPSLKEVVAVIARGRGMGQSYRTISATLKSLGHQISHTTVGRLCKEQAF